MEYERHSNPQLHLSCSRQSSRHHQVFEGFSPFNSLLRSATLALNGARELKIGACGEWIQVHEVSLDYDKFIKAKGGRTRAGWMVNEEDFWIEECGRIMEPPDFPVPPGRYWVTGGRQAASILTMDDSKDEWKLDSDVKRYDVTHLPCRAERYRPNQMGGGSPAMADLSDFPVQPAATMPTIKGCTKQDYAVLFVIGVEDV